MDKQQLLNKYTKPEDKLLISKMLDKMKLAQTRNSIEYTDFLDALIAELLRTSRGKGKYNIGAASGTKRNGRVKVTAYQYV